MEWYAKAAEMEEAEAITGIGKCYFYGYGVPQDYDKALEYFFKGAELEDTSAMLHLMKCYNEGLGVKIDPDKAEYYRKKVFGKNRDSED